MKEGVVMFAGYATSMIKWPHHRRPQLSHLHGSLRRGVSAALVIAEQNEKHVCDTTAPISGGDGEVTCPGRLGWRMEWASGIS